VKPRACSSPDAESVGKRLSLEEQKYQELMNNPYLSLPKKYLKNQHVENHEAKEEQRHEIKNSEKKQDIVKPTGWGQNPFASAKKLINKTSVSFTTTKPPYNYLPFLTLLLKNDQPGIKNSNIRNPFLTDKSENPFAKGTINPFAKAGKGDFFNKITEHNSKTGADYTNSSKKKQYFPEQININAKTEEEKLNLENDDLVKSASPSKPRFRQAKDDKNVLFKSEVKMFEYADKQFDNCTVTIEKQENKVIFYYFIFSYTYLLYETLLENSSSQAT
jgi:hypothetical protein